VTAHEFRTLALALPAALEGAHVDHPDFRVRGKIFASLGPHEAWGMVKLTPEQQREFVRDEPKVFQPFNGAWGARGCTKVHLLAAKKQTVRRALVGLAQHSTQASFRAVAGRVVFETLLRNLGDSVRGELGPG
jgi:hypothetical protein